MPMLTHSPPSQLSDSAGSQARPARPAQPSTQTTVPISLQSNPDAIALRSALSILQLQRAQSVADLQALEAIKTQATSSVEAFTHEVRAGRVKMGSGSVGLLGSEMGDVRPAKRSRRDVTQSGSEDESSSSSSRRGDDPDDEIMADDDDDVDEKASVDLSHQHQPFPAIPGPQNIVRCPPINWTKYHVVGESLEKLHEEQRSRPTNGEPSTDGDDSKPVAASTVEPPRAEKAVIAAPLRPLAGGDNLAKTGKSEGVRTRRKKN